MRLRKIAIASITLLLLGVVFTKPIVYFGAGVLFGSVSLFSRAGWAICQLFPSASSSAEECLLLSDLSYDVTAHALKHALIQSSSVAPLLSGKIPDSHASWHLNQDFLSQIPAFTAEEKKLLLFLKKRWLAKSVGFFPSIIDWVFPCFGIAMQVHPETTSCYSRNPTFKLSLTYQNRMEAWKKILPHPHEYPLILTRPADLHSYFPTYFSVSLGEGVADIVSSLNSSSTATLPLIVDLTAALSTFSSQREEWLPAWEKYRSSFLEACLAHHIDPKQILCIQKLQQEGIGGLRLLPLLSEQAESQYNFLLDWIGSFGLSANRVELDRWPVASPISPLHVSSPPFTPLTAAGCFSYIPETSKKSILLDATINLLKGLISSVSEDKWETLTHDSTRSALIRLSFQKIQEQLHLLEVKNTPFLDRVSHIEQIHAYLSSLLEVFSPFTSEDFASTYLQVLNFIPPSLQPLASCGIHTSGMTNLTAILKATEQMLGQKPHVLYGENTYYECMHTTQLFAGARCVTEGDNKDYEDVDLLIAQFNPVFKKQALNTSYKTEKIAETVQRILKARQKPLVLALDCTIDSILSSRTQQLLTLFQHEIEVGKLNVICTHSGLKFDLFGMDNYCGAPFYMLHNQESTWKSFDLLLNDPALQSDSLSLNWFTLAYRFAMPQLELYRRQIFDNTRAILNWIPKRLLQDKTATYRVIPFEENAESSFIDIKVFGPLHAFKAAVLAGGCLCIKSMEEGHPVFFRPSFGFYHPNLTMLFEPTCSSIRLTIGLDPSQIELFVKCFERLDLLNEIK